MPGYIHSGSLLLVFSNYLRLFQYVVSTSLQISPMSPSDLACRRTNTVEISQTETLTLSLMLPQSDTPESPSTLCWPFSNKRSLSGEKGRIYPLAKVAPVPLRKMEGMKTFGPNLPLKGDIGGKFQQKRDYCVHFTTGEHYIGCDRV